MRLIAIRQRYENGVRVNPGEMFEVEKERVGFDLLSKGLARMPDPPVILYQTKVVTPQAPEVQAATAASFRDLHLPDQEPAPVAARVNPVLPSTDAPKPGAPDRSKRRGRKRPGSR